MTVEATKILYTRSSIKGLCSDESCIRYAVYRVRFEPGEAYVPYCANHAKQACFDAAIIGGIQQ